jgi:hypothetical protein
MYIDVPTHVVSLNVISIEKFLEKNTIGANSVAEQLKTNSTLQEINLEDIQIGNEEYKEKQENLKTVLSNGNQRYIGRS